MINITKTNLYVGSLSDLPHTNSAWAFVHATQTSHYKAMGWSRKTVDRNSPNYVIYEKGNHLYLNWVDGKASLYNWSGVSTFIKILDFINKWIKDNKVLIHCDQGNSRAPSVALLYLAKRLKIIPNDSFAVAKNEFVKLYPHYSPGGIARYVELNWDKIL